MDNKHISGRKVWLWRKRNNLSQKAAANELGVHDRTIRNWESGKHIPSRGMLLAMRAVDHKLTPLGHDLLDHAYPRPGSSDDNWRKGRTESGSEI